MSKTVAAAARHPARRWTAPRNGMLVRVLVPLAFAGCMPAVAIAQCGRPPVAPPPVSPPPVSPPPVSPPPVVTPVAQVAAPAEVALVNGPARAGYCDASGTFYDLAIGQDKEAPWSSLDLRPADVDAVTGAISCVMNAPAAAPTFAEPAIPAAPALPKAPVRRAAPRRPHVRHQLPPVRHTIDPGHGRTLPFTP